jgi:4-amino-4-deoxy-L-arabinose transferase-like glycosyltransferase
LGSPLKRLALALALAALYLTALDRPELLDPDESRHAEIAREMLDAGRFLTPRVYDQPYHDKPVGFHWTVVASLATLGHGTAAARLPAALAALATLAITGWWAQRLRGDDAGSLAALGLGTSLLFLAIGRLATVDMLFTALLTGAVAWLSVGMTEELPRRRSVVPFYALVALASLVKGPVAIVLAMPCLLVAHAWLRKRETKSWLRPLAGAATVLAIAGPWYAAAYHADPEYVKAFLGLHNLDRFLGSDALGHQRSLGYYALALPAALLPWTPLVATGLLLRWRERRAEDGGDAVLWAWIAAVGLVFGAASTRLVTYLLPAFPALFVGGACGLVSGRSDARTTSRTRIWMDRYAVVWVVIVATSTLVAACMAQASLRGMPGVGLRSAVAATLAVGSVAFVSQCVANRTANAAVLGLAVSSLVTVVGAYGPVADLLTAAKGYRSLASELDSALPPNGVVSSLSRAPHALSFYLRRPIGRVQDLPEARALLAGDAPVFLLTKPRYADVLLAEETDGIETWWRNEQGTTLVVNRAAASVWRRREGVEPSADLYGRQHGFEDRSGHRTRSLSTIEKSAAIP